ncbi:VOC family protein [Cellulomonas massiliensis]|uniref:VOC family protein n=1 Tax=Cellulomonas massiliensis TaxID=1465811 RepID=UPI000474DF9B|nr:VOC family protein [Cellulomonas massiliensis]
MTHVTGIGGYFLRAADPEALVAWYRDVLGLPTDRHGQWEQEAGPSVLAAFPADTDAFGSDQRTMLNLRVRDLDGLLAQLRERGAVVSDQVEEMAGVGRFGRVADPEGNVVELWEPAP